MQVVNAPGRFDRAPSLVAHDIERWTCLVGVSVVFCTEVANAARAAALAVDGWTVHHRDGRGEGECAILTRDVGRTVVARRWVELDDGGGTGRLSVPNVAPVVIVEGESGRRTLLTGAHLRAHLEGIWTKIPLPSRTRVRRLRKSSAPIIKAWIADVDKWRHAVHHLAAEYHVDDIIVAADWNLNGDRKWVRQLMRELWPGLAMARTDKPDLGRRNIGWLLTTMNLTDSEVFKAESSDHKAGRFTLAHVNPPKPEKPAPVLEPPDPFEHVTYNGALMDQKTKAAVQLGEKRLGYPLTILQGCYHPGVSQSAGTHDGGQVIDFAPFDFENKVRTFREMGWFIWHRLPIPGVWGEHIHGGIRNGGTLSPSAKAQQVDFDHYPTGKRDGLAAHNPDPDQFPPEPQAFSYRSAWHEING